VSKLTLSVAGGRKTHSIVEDCCRAPAEERILVLTYTQANQSEIRDRLLRLGPQSSIVHVRGWFSFLLRDWVGPFLPRLFDDQRLRGLNFEAEPHRMATGKTRFLDPDGRAYKRNLACLAYKVNTAAGGAAADRLERLYDTIYVDEVQDLNGWDLEIVGALLSSGIDVRLVGDIRQAILFTNVQDQKNSQYKGTKVINWFRQQERAGLLEIEHQSETWRCIQPIADLADSIFDETWGFARTTSRATEPSGHSGLHTVAPTHAETYAKEFDAFCLRSRSDVGNNLDLPYTTIGHAKGMEAEHVLIWPTGTMLQFLGKAKPLAVGTACAFYVAITRARSSVALITDERIDGFREWAPG